MSTLLKSSNSKTKNVYIFEREGAKTKNPHDIQQMSRLVIIWSEQTNIKSTVEQASVTHETHLSIFIEFASSDAVNTWGL